DDALPSLVNGDTVTSVTLTSAGTDPTAIVGGYEIDASNAVGSGLSNYSIQYLPGTLTVNAAALFITANSQNKTYGDSFTFQGTEFTPSGLVNGDTVTSVTLTSAGTDPTAIAGGYETDASNAVRSGLSNYSIQYLPGTLTVNAAALIVTPNDASRPFGDPNPTFTGTLSGLVNGDNITANYTTTATSSSPAGTYPITATLNDPNGLLGNYNVSL